MLTTIRDLFVWVINVATGNRYPYVIRVGCAHCHWQLHVIRWTRAGAAAAVHLYSEAHLIGHTNERRLPLAPASEKMQ